MKFRTPTMVMGNTQSVRNKMDELQACVRFSTEYRKSAVICLSETWLDESVTDTEIILPGFTCIRGDRTSASGKRKMVEACVSLSTNAGVTTQPRVPRRVFRTLHSSLSRGFPKIYLCMVYCHPKVNIDNACSVLTDHIHELEKNFPDVPEYYHGGL